jgi:hypothetical protein
MSPWLSISLCGPGHDMDFAEGATAMNLAEEPVPADLVISHAGHLNELGEERKVGLLSHAVMGWSRSGGIAACRRCGGGSPRQMS